MLKPIRFRDRSHAGRLLAERLLHYRGVEETIVLGLPRGGVPVADEVARALEAPLDVFVVRKLGAPSQPELALGAIGSGGVTYLNQDVITSLGISEDQLAAITAREHAELQRREILFRGHNAPRSFKDRVVIIIDDGLATGATMMAAIQAIKTQSPRKLVVGVPVAPVDTAQRIKQNVDEFICLTTPTFFAGVGSAYEDFSQTSSEDVVGILRQLARLSRARKVRDRQNGGSSAKN
jgi:putative phosphoribosyl transferase